MTDLLKLIIEKQKQFQIELGNEIPKSEDIISSKNIQFLSYQILSMFDELSEALHELPWKPWKHHQKFEKDKFWEELIDVFHFLLNCFIFSGIDNENSLYSLFKRKNKINRLRQEEGY